MPKKNISMGYTLITGASAGIGAELARVFASKGHDLIVAARNVAALDKLAENLRSTHKVKVEVIAADLAAPHGAYKLHSAVQAKSLEVDVLVNNAGILGDGPFLDQSLDMHMNTLAVNVGSLMALCHLFGNDMKPRRRGYILNVCSTSAFQPVPNLASYAASKAFVLSLSEALAIEIADSGIKVTAVCPGFTATELIQKQEGGSMSLPGVPLLTPKQVAQESYEALMKGKAVHVNGIANRVLQVASEYQPRWLAQKIGKVMYKRGL